MDTNIMEDTKRSQLLRFEHERRNMTKENIGVDIK